MGKEMFNPCDSRDLVLTNIRTFQQKKNSNKKVLKNPYRKFRALSSPPRFCNKHRVVFLKKDDNGKIYLAKSKGIPCNTWGCPACRIVKAKRLRFQLIEIIKLNKLDHLLTLTLDPKSIPDFYLVDVNKTGKYITFLFNKFLVTLKRKTKKPIKFVWVKEFQKNGNAHLHIVLSVYLPIKYLRSEWVRIGGGHVMDIQRVKNIEAVAVYISDYLTKMAVADGNFLVNERRYSISQSCVKPPKFIVNKVAVTDLYKYLPTDQIFVVYNLLKYSTKPEELILAPHQEKLNI